MGGMKAPVQIIVPMVVIAVLAFTISFAVAFVHGSAQSIPSPSPTIPTERAPGCLDGTLEPGCPDFNIQPPKEIKTVTETKTGYLITFADDSTETWTIR